MNSSYEFIIMKSNSWIQIEYNDFLYLNSCIFEFIYIFGSLQHFVLHWVIQAAVLPAGPLKVLGPAILLQFEPGMAAYPRYVETPYPSWYSNHLVCWNFRQQHRFLIDPSAGAATSVLVLRAPTVRHCNWSKWFLLCSAEIMQCP